MSFMKKNVAYRTKKNGVYEIKCGSRKKMDNSWALKKKIGVKSKKLVTWNIRKNVV